MKTIYKALCGNPKFDVSTSLNAAQFKEFVKSLARGGDLAQLKEKIAVLEKAVQGEVLFAGALDNPTFVEIIEVMRKFKPESDPKEPAAKESKK